MKKSDIAIPVMLMCAWLVLDLLAGGGNLVVNIASVFLLTYLLIKLIVLFHQEKENQTPCNKCVTPLCDETFEAMGFWYNAKHDRWQIGRANMDCFVSCYKFNETSQMIECFNFVSGKGEHFFRIVSSVEEVLKVFDACGITQKMIERSQRQ